MRGETASPRVYKTPINLDNCEGAELIRQAVSASKLRLFGSRVIKGKDLTIDEKIHLCVRFQDYDGSITSFAKAHSMPPSTMVKYLQKFDILALKGKNLFNDSCGGRPPLIDAVTLNLCQNEFKEAYIAQNSVLTNSFNDILVSNHIISREKKGLGPKTTEISKTSKRRYKKLLDLKDVLPQKKTQTRIEAEMDIRNAYAMFITVKAYADFFPPQLKFNFDAYHVYVTPSDDNCSSCVMIPKNLEDGEPKLTPTRPSGGELSYAVKVYFLHNASGTCGDPVYVLALNDFVDKDYFSIHSIYGLGISTCASNKGYVCLVRTRNTNSAFLEYYFNNIVLPYIELTKEVSALQENAALLYFDGEQIQVDTFMKKEIMDNFTNNKVFVAKTPASCSAITQASDVCSFFRSTKKKVGYLEKKDWHNPIVERSLDSMFATQMKPILPGKTITAHAKKRMGEAIMLVNCAMRMCLTHKVIMEGYEKTGQHPLNFEKAMNQSGTFNALNAQQIQTLKNGLEPLCQKIREEGFLSEAVMDEYNIPNFNKEGSIDKDQRAIHHQRAVILNEKHCIKMFLESQQKKIDNLLHVNEKKRKREEAQKEKARKQLLTAEQRKEEAQRKSALTRRINKERKENERLLQLEQGTDDVLVVAENL
jgi:hypothetical protein